jgi:diguanylate cyclase
VSDEVVTVLLGRISDTLRSGDLVARIDAGQLVVILRGVHDLKGALRVVERIQAEVNEPVLLPIGDIEQSMSAGVTLIHRGESVDSVLDRAEGALELAVQAGANRIITSPPL